MFCSHCGRELSQGESCPVCYPAAAATPPVAAATRAAAGSVWMLLACLSYTLFTAVSLVNIFQASFVKSVGESAINWWTAILFLSPALPILIGLWRLYAAGHSRRSGFSTAGLTLIKAGVIVSIVFLGIVSALFLVAAMVGSLQRSSSSWGLSSFDTDGGLLFVVIGGLLAVLFVYCGRLLCTLGLIRRNLTAPVVSHQVSVLVVVCNSVMLLVQLFRVLTYFIYIPLPLPLATRPTSLGLAATILEILFLASFSAALLQYRHLIHKLAGPAYPVATPYSVQPVQTGAPVYTAAAVPVPQPISQASGEPFGTEPSAYCRHCGQPLAPGESGCRQCGMTISNT